MKFLLKPNFMKGFYLLSGVVVIILSFSVRSWAQGPGNVTTNLDLWLKSNAGTSTTTDGVDITQWDDQTAGTNHATEGSNSPVYRNNSTDNINFYPVVDFNGTDDRLTGLAGFDNAEIFIVLHPDNTISSAATAEYPLGWNATGVTNPTQSGLGLGIVDGTLTDEVVTYFIGSTQYRRGYTDNAVSYTSPIIINLTENGSVEEIRINNQQLDDQQTGVFAGFTDEPYTVGARHDLTSFFDGSVTEVISYTAGITTDRPRVVSYLALKYGITIDQTSATDYVASDGSTLIWDSSAPDAATYNNDIAGIGFDNDSELSQPEGTSVNADAILTISADGEGTNISPSLTDIADDEFLSWGNNDGAATWTTTDAPTTYQILSREWSIQETGDVAEVTVAFNVADADFDVPDRLSGTSYYLVIDTDDDGNLSDETPTLLYDDGTNGDASASDDIWTIQGIDFDDAEEFTLATSSVGPAGITANLTLWLKSDVGTSTTTDGVAMTQWDDQSGDDNHATELTNSPTFRNNTTDNVNSNPVIDFDGTNDLMTGTAGFDTDEYFVVIAPDNMITSASTAEFPLGWNATGSTSPDNSGLGLGNVTSITDDVVAHVIGGTDYERVYTDNALTISDPLILNSYENTTQEIRINHEMVDNNGSGSFAAFTNEAYTLSARHDQSSFYNGSILEVISLTSSVTATERQQITSYLALKYGISLDQTSATDYLASDGGAIWDGTTNATYNNDIAGIGRDDNSGLDQRSSSNVTSNTILTVANGDLASPSSFFVDDSFIIWGHDGNPSTFGTDNLTNGDGTTSNRMNRIWRVDETGTVGSIEISFSNLLATGDVSIVIHPTDATFPADANRRIANMTDNGSDYEVTVDFADGEFFSFVNANTSTVAFTTVVINEIITEPQQDWSSSNFFDANPGGSPGGSGEDEWVELLINEAGLDLTGWTIELNDGTDVSGDLTSSGAFSNSNYLSTTGGTFTNTAVGDYLILGGVSAGTMDNDITVVLRNASSTIIDQIALGTDGNGPSGNSSSTEDESVSRIPNGQDLNDDANDLILTRTSLGSTNSPTGTAVINEVVTDPQQDWSSIAFSGAPPGGSAGSDDEWIELYVSSDGINLAGWTIELTDGSDVTGDLTSSGAFQVSNYVGTGGGTFTDTRIGDFLVLGNVAGTGAMNNDVLVVLRDASGTIIDQVQLGGAGGQAPSGASSGTDDESINRYPNATDTDTDDADFIQTIATLGSTNSLSGTVVINEIVTDPQQDWSTNGFNGTNGGDVIDTDDEWIELYITTAGINLTGWTIQLNDGTNVSGELTTTGSGIFGTTRYTSSSSGSFLSTAVGDYLVLGNPTGDMDDIIQVTLLDATGTTIDQVQFGSGGAPSGTATTEADESVSRLPNGTDTDNDNADFTKTPVSMGANNSLTPLPAIGNALNFDGVDEYVEVSDNANLDIIGALTLEAWVNIPSTLTNTAGVVSKFEDTGNQRSYALQIDASDQPLFSISGNGSTSTSVTSSSSLTTNTWHHLAAVYDPSNALRVYLDGILVGENTTSIPANIFSGSAPLWIAAVSDETVSNNLINASIDELRIWDDIRSQEEICENKNTTVDDGEANLVAYYRFDRSSGTVLSDVGPNNLDGTLNNMEDVDWVAAGWDVFAENAAILNDGTSTITSGVSSELTVADVNFLNDSQDKLLVGHDAQDFSEIQTDLPSGTLVTNRYGRNWHLSLNDGAGTVGGNVTFTFDLGAAINDDYTYYLLGRSGTSGDYSVIPINRSQATGTTVTINVAVGNLTDDNYYTLGRSDAGPGNALDFDDTSSDYVSLANPASFNFGTGNFTIEGWVRLDDASLATAQVILSDYSGGAGTNELTLWVSSNEVNGAIGSAAVDIVTSSSPISSNQWHHIALVRTGDNASIYVDGAQEATASGLVARDISSADNLNIGRQPNGSPFHLDGLIDEVRIWNTNRSQDEIVSNLFQNILSTDADFANLVAYYRFNQGIGNNITSLPDLSTNANVGTLTNFDNLSTTTESSNYVNVTNNATASLNRLSLMDNVVIINPVGGGTDILTAASDELTLTSTTSDFLQDEGDFIAWGNDDGGFTETTNDLPTGTLLTNRITKTWSLSKNDESTNNGNVTFTFDFGATPDPDNTYYLLKRTGTSGNFEVTEVIGSRLNGNNILFTVDAAQIDDGSYYTLGRSGSGPGNTLDFDGSDDYISVADDAALQLTSPMTIEAWIRTESNSRQGVISKKTSGLSNAGYTIYLDAASGAASINLETQNATATTMPANIINLNVWNHIAYVVDGTVTFYLNGQKQTMLSAVASLATSSDELTLGSEAGGTNPFNGQIDEVRIWSDARSETEIQQNMHRSLDVDTEGNLVAYYKFNQGIAGGTNNSPAVDLLPDQSDNDHSGALNNFTLTGSTTNWIASQAVISDQSSAQALIGPGNALDFDGLDDYVAFGSPPLTATDNLTIEAWIRPDAFSGTSYAVYNGTLASDGYGISFDASGNIGITTGNDGSVVSGTALATGSWSHVVAVRNSGTWELYVNGFAVDITFTQAPDIPNTAAAIGADDTGANAFDGLIDEVRFWSAARSTAEIQDNMFKQLVGNETDLVSYYTFNEENDITSTVLLDQTASNNGNLTNMSASADWVTASAREPFKTTNTGNWNDTDTWKTRTIPNATSADIDFAHNVTMDVSRSAGLVNVNSGITLILSTGFDLSSDNNIINNNTITGRGFLILSGTNSISGGSYNNIRLNTSNATLFGDISMTGTLNLLDGQMILDDFNLTANNITGVNAATDDFVVTKNQNSSGGFLTLNIDNADGEVTFPIASNGDYTPVTILNLGTTGNLNARVFDDVFANGTSGSNIASGDEVNKTWEITGDAGVNVTITFQWNGTDEGAGFTTERSSGGNDEIFISQNSSGFWQTITVDGAASGSDPYTKSVSGITTFSTFGVGALNSPLPIELTAFQALAHEGKVFLDWQTATEINNDYFEIERSVDGENFEMIGTHAGAGNSSHVNDYSFVDVSPYSGMNYYRLKQVNYDGESEYSNMVSAMVDFDHSTSLLVYPNPFEDTFTVEFEDVLPPSSSLQILNVSGRIISQTTLIEPTFKLQLDLGSLKSGIYFMKINTGKRVLIERLSKK